MNTLDYLREQHRLDGQKNPLAFDKLIDRVLVVLNPCSEEWSKRGQDGKKKRNRLPCYGCPDLKECRKLFDRLC